MGEKSGGFFYVSTLTKKECEHEKIQSKRRGNGSYEDEGCKIQNLHLDEYGGMLPDRRRRDDPSPSVRIPAVPRNSSNLGFVRKFQNSIKPSMELSAMEGAFFI